MLNLNGLTKISKNVMPAILAGMSLLSACDSVIYDGEGDCSYRNGIRFVYDWNMKRADAFPSEVKAVRVWAFGQDGTLAAVYADEGDRLGEPGYVLPVDLPPGSYDLVAWCSWKRPEAAETLPFTIPSLAPGHSTKEELTATLERVSQDGEGTVADDIDPLYHGVVSQAVFSDEPGEHTATMRLKKYTNSVRVVLQQLSGEPVDASRFSFSITSADGKMDYTGALLPDERLRYRAWHVSQGSAGMETGDGATVTVNTAVAELTTARLVKEDRPVLTVTNDKGERVLSIPLIDYLLMVKGYYGQQMDDQEYLDRQDEYSLTFFLDRNYAWVNTQVIINSWVVVINDETVGRSANKKGDDE